MTSAQEDAILELESRRHIGALRAAYGPDAMIQYQRYFGESGQWKARYKSEFGFHIRGHGTTCAQAVAAAIKAAPPEVLS